MSGNFFYNKLGENIIRFRSRKKLSQEELSFFSGVDRAYISRIEKGKANPTLKVIWKISCGLKTRMEKLFKKI